MVAGLGLESAPHFLGRPRDIEPDMGGVPLQMAASQIGVHRVVLGVEHAQRAGATLQAGPKRHHRRFHDARETFQIIAAVRQIVVDARLQRHDRAALVAQTGEHDQGQRELALPHGDHEVQPGAVGKVQVDDHGVERRSRELELPEYVVRRRDRADDAMTFEDLEQ